MDFSNLPENIVELAINGGWAILIFLVGHLVSIGVGKLVRGLLARFMQDEWARYVANIVRLAVYIVTLNVIVDRTGAAGALVVIITALTGAFSIGSERMAADLIGGMKLFFLKYYKVGDVVTIDGMYGEVIDINLTFTTLKNSRRDMIILPNAAAVDGIIINHSAIRGHYLETSVPIQGKHDRAEVIEVMRLAADKYKPQLEDASNPGPLIFFENTGVDTSYYRVRVIIPDTASLTKPRSDLRTLVIDALEEAGYIVAEKVPAGMIGNTNAPK